ncbi:MAG: hypothetical protein DRJ67_08165 [Thermoprotei archaeon]|nr:MAG: hypothetical protein DRJ67_08165 [Thermoprotei archaeon]
MKEWSHHLVPFLCPTWIALMSGYRDFVGPCAKRGSYAVEGVNRLRTTLKPVVEAAERREHEAFLREQVKLLRGLLSEELWFPVRPLSSQLLRELKASAFREAARSVSYAEVSLRLLRCLERVARTYMRGHRVEVQRGLADTLLYVMRSALALVPSAVFASIVPDISLYSHSRFVAGLATAFALMGPQPEHWRARLLVIDANGIQRFVAAPIAAAAASRIIRGRSMLVQLALDALANYALELFGLTEASLLIDGGGTLTLVVPDSPDLSEKLEKLRRMAVELSKELGGGLEFTIAKSKSFDVRDASFIHALLRGGGFPEVIESCYQEDLAVEKARRQARYLGVVAQPSDIIDYDSLTWEPVLRRQRWRLEVDEVRAGYADSVAGPGNLSIGDSVSQSTHLSLVLGTTLRNLIAVVSMHVYRLDEAPLPDPELINVLTDAVLDHVAKLVNDEVPSGGLMCRGPFLLKNTRMRVAAGLVPLPSTGSLYLTVAHDSPEPLLLEEQEGALNNAWIIVLSVVGEALRAASRALEVKGRIRLVVRVRLVNVFEGFLPPAGGAPEELLRKSLGILEDLRRRGVDADISFGFVFTNTYHPAFEKDGRVELVSLDAMELIAMFKLDVDRAGELVQLSSFSPSRLVTLSDLLNLVLIGKTYFEALYRALELRGRGALDVVPLYAGGDDVVCYGRWTGILLTLAKLLRSVREALYPLTASAAVVIDRSKAPLLDLYSATLSLLEEAKNYRASLVLLGGDYWVDLEWSGHAKLVNAFEAIEGAWPNDPAKQDVARALEEFLAEGRVIRLEGYKDLLHMLSVMGYFVQEAMKRNWKPLSQLKGVDRLRLEVMYVYVWSRRRKELEGLADELERFSVRITRYPGDLVRALRTLAHAKPLLDIALLALRRPSHLEPIRPRE